VVGGGQGRNPKLVGACEMFAENGGFQAARFSETIISEGS
jgi:hypothetical protein